MAAKNPSQDPGLEPELNNGIDYRGNTKYSFDLGTPDKIFTCASCHSGGILEFDRITGKRHDEEESWDETKDGSGFFSQADYKDSQIDGDLFSYTQDEYSRGYIGKPHKFNWKKSGVLDTDCFLCHASRSLAESENLTVQTANGWKAVNPTPANPRVFIFVKKDPDGKVVEITLGFPPQLTDEEKNQGYTIDSAAFYSDPLERLVALYYSDVIQYCIENSGIDLSNADQQTLERIKSYTTAVITGALKRGITTGFNIDYTRFGGNNFTYDDSQNSNRLSSFFGQFYLDVGAPNYLAKDYLRDAFYESTVEGQPYVGGGLYLRQTDLSSSYSYKPFDPNETAKIVNLARAGFFFGWADSGTLMGIADPNDPTKPIAFVVLKKNPETGRFEAKTYYAEDVDLSEVQLPILQTSGAYSLAKPDSTKETGVVKYHNGSSDKDLGLMCGQCHFAIPDTENKWTPDGKQFFPSWYVRRGIIGLGADVVKRGAVYAPQEHENDPSVAPIAIDSNGEINTNLNATEGLPVGYDVHFDSNKGDLTCLSCHGQDNLSKEEKLKHNPHNFLKGNDPAGEVMPALDYNPSVQTCQKCHWGSDEAAAKVHENWFGPAAKAHISSITCQVCHIPFKTYWSFRFFDDTMGYSNQFDDRLKSMSIQDNQLVAQQFPPEWAIPAFAPSPTYGINYSYVIAQTDDDGNDVTAPIFQIDMDPYRAMMRVGNTMFGNWAIQKGLFPWRWEPVIIRRHTIGDDGQDVVKAGLINPIQVATWVDAKTGRALFVREMNMAIDGVAYDSSGKPLGRSTIDPEEPEKSVPGITINPNTHKLAYKIHWVKGNPGGLPDYIDDDNGDGLPEINTDAEYMAMKEALKQVLDAEDPDHPHDPVILFAMAPFGVDHGVLPKEYSLGAQKDGPFSCNACHNSDESKNRLSPAVWSGDESAGREITLAPMALPEKAIEESKAAGFWKVPEGAEVKDGKIVITQGAMARFTSVPVESKEYAGYYLITPDGKVSGPVSEEVKISAEPGAVDVPTAVKVEKVENSQLEDGALEKAKEEGIENPVLATDILDIHTKDNKFNAPITFTVKYDPEKVSGKVAVMVSEDGKSWSKLAEFTVDPDNPFVTFARQNLSYFAVVGSAPSSTSTTTVSTSGGGGGGGCSMGAPQSAANGLANVGALLSGLLGLLIGKRRKRS
ncbi:hypothetical protein [Thermovibrio sp.]